MDRPGRPPVSGVMLASDDPRLDRLAALIAGSPHNLVAGGERAVLRERHIAEGLALAWAVGERLVPGSGWLDLGTGGGLPGLVLALAAPAVEWTLVDAVEKKVRAVAAFARELELDNVRAVTGRAEVLAHEAAHRGRYAGVVARAVAPVRTLAELARGFVGDGGCLVAVKGPQWEAEIAAAAGALDRCGWSSAQGERLASAARPTTLVTMRAVGAPPPGIPRRTGVPHRRPF